VSSVIFIQRGKVRSCGVASACMLLLASAMLAQHSEPGDDSGVFKAVAELVVVPVSVTDSHRNFVPGLTPADRRLYEDGRLQKITAFHRENVPVTVGLILDHSRSMETKLRSVRAAVLSFAQSSNPEDEMFVVDFSDRVRSEIFRGKLFTNDVSELQNALAAVGAEGGTALYDAIYQGLERLRVGHRNKKSLIIVSDGGDNASQHKYHQVLAMAHQSEAVIYAIGLVGAPGEEEKPKILERLCKDTGGLAFFPHTLDPVHEVSNRIARDLREQYTLAYAPDRKVSGDSFRKIDVKVSAPGHEKLHVRTRLGYSTAGLEAK